MTQREELLSVPKRKWDDVIHGVDAVYIIPSGRKHDSGYACMDFVASFNGNKKRPMCGLWCGGGGNSPLIQENSEARKKSGMTSFSMVCFGTVTNVEKEQEKQTSAPTAGLT